MLVSGDKHDIFSSESTGLTDMGSRSNIQIRAGYYNYQTEQQTTHLTNQ
jgi:hypothetical protein